MRFRLDTAEWGELAEEFRDMAERTPELTREFLDEMVDEAAISLKFVYQTEPGEGHNLPTEDLGFYGEAIRTQVASGPQRSWAALVVDSPYAEFLETGRSPGPIPREIIEDWAFRKLGLAPDSPQVKVILRNIWRFGVAGQQLFFRALHTSTSHGQAIDRKMEAKADWLMRRMLGSAR